MKSLNIIFPERKRVELKEEELGPPGDGELLCAAEKSLISTGTELSCLKGVFDPGTNWDSWVKYPFYPGYSMVGSVLEKGRGVKGLMVGDRVVSYQPHGQYFTVPAGELYPVLPGIDAEEATFAPLACTTQLGVRRAKLELGETAGVIGLGILGQLVVQYLRIAGAASIIAVDPLEERLILAKNHGASHLLPMSVDKAYPAIKELTDEKMLDVLFEITGNAEALAGSVRLLRMLGRLVLLGDSPTPSKQRLAPGVVSNSISILGIHGFAHPREATVFSPWSRAVMIHLFFDFLGQGRMKVKDLITHRYSPLEAPKVYEQLLKDPSQALAVVFDWGQL